MMGIIDYVLAHTDRGECKCGKCFDRGDKPDPTGHVADMVFFKVAAKDSPTKEEFERLLREYPQHGEYADIDVFDGKKHGYMELGAWLGSQQVALLLMGLGALLGTFELLTPHTMLKLPEGDPLAKAMAGQGLVAIMAKKDEERPAVQASG